LATNSLEPNFSSLPVVFLSPFPPRTQRILWPFLATPHLVRPASPAAQPLSCTPYQPPRPNIFLPPSGQHIPHGTAASSPLQHRCTQSTLGHHLPFACRLLTWQACSLPKFTSFMTSQPHKSSYSIDNAPLNTVRKSINTKTLFLRLYFCVCVCVHVWVCLCVRLCVLSTHTLPNQLEGKWQVQSMNKSDSP
jgi:hypothetical protein